MRSYQTLAVLALAASTASPALSAPVLENRAAVASEVAPEIASKLTGILKTLGIGAGLGALPVALESFLGGNSTARRDLDERAFAIGSLFDDLLGKLGTDGSIGKVLGEGLLGGVASGAGALGVSHLLNNTRREPEPISLSEFSGLGKTLAGTLASLAAATGVQDLFGSNSTLLKRSFSLANITGIAEDVLGTLGGGGLGNIAHDLSLIGLRDDASTQTRDLIDALQLLSREIDELD